MDHLVKISNLSKSFTNGSAITEAVKDVSFDVYSGESIAIMGPSGCGKTTLLNMIGLVIPPSEGAVIIDGVNALDLGDALKSKFRNSFFGYIYQDFMLIENESVYNNVMIPLLYAIPKEKAETRKDMVRQIVDEVGLISKLDEKVKNLSGGQRQRVAIARAIINQPKVILADEPTGALDVATGKSIIELLERKVDKGVSLLLVTHDEGIANSCTRKLEMLDGEIIG